MMDIGDILGGGGLVISGVALGRLLDFALRIWEARNQKTELKPNPLNVHMEEEPEKKFVTRADFEKHVAEVQRRFEAGNTAFKELRKEITGMREDLHAGLARINDRISPVAESCAANGAAIQILLKAKERKP